MLSPQGVRLPQRGRNYNMNEILTKQAVKEIKFFIKHWQQNPYIDNYGLAYELYPNDPDFRGTGHIRREAL